MGSRKEKSQDCDREGSEDEECDKVRGRKEGSKEAGAVGMINSRDEKETGDKARR